MKIKTLITIIGLTLGTTIYSCKNYSETLKNTFVKDTTEINYNISNQKIDGEIINFQEEQMRFTLNLNLNKKRIYHTIYPQVNKLSVFKPDGRFAIYLDINKNSKFDYVYTGNVMQKKQQKMIFIRECNDTIQTYIQNKAENYLKKIINYKNSLKKQKQKKESEKKALNEKDIYESLK